MSQSKIIYQVVKKMISQKKKECKVYLEWNLMIWPISPIGWKFVRLILLVVIKHIKIIFI